MVVRGLIEERDTVFRDSLSFCARRWREEDGLHGGLLDIVKLIFKGMRESSLRLGEKPDDIISTFGFATVGYL